MKTFVLSVVFSAIFAAAVAFAQAQKVESIYTSLDPKKCKTLELVTTEAGHYRGLCSGVGGYKLESLEDDIRQSINVITPNRKKFELDYWTNVSGAFSYVGAKAEWRIKRLGKKIIPIALIVRFDASENPDDALKTNSYLVVSKITAKEICITDVVDPKAGANEEARSLAEAKVQKPCRVRED